MDKLEEYPYDIGEKIIGEVYPIEMEQGGVIDFIDCGELHSLLADFWNKTRAPTTREKELTAAQEKIKILENHIGSIQAEELFGEFAY